MEIKAKQPESNQCECGSNCPKYEHFDSALKELHQLKQFWSEIRLDFQALRESKKAALNNLNRNNSENTIPA